MDGEDASASEFQERMNMLKSIGDPIFFRSGFYVIYIFSVALLESILIYVLFLF